MWGVMTGGASSGRLKSQTHALLSHDTNTWRPWGAQATAAPNKGEL